MGLRELHRVLLDSSRTVELTGVDEQTFRHLKLIDNEDRRIVFRQVGFRVMGCPNGPPLCSELSEVTIDEQGRTTVGNIEVLGLGANIVPGHTQAANDGSSEPPFVPAYFHFLHDMVELGGCIMGGIQLEMLELVRRISARARTYDRALAVHVIDHVPLGPVLQDLHLAITDCMRSPCKQAEDLRKKLVQRATDIQEIFGDIDNRELQLNQQLLTFPDFLPDLRALTDLMEDRGVAVGNLIHNLNLVTGIKHSLGILALRSLDVDELEDLRDDFEIMDIDSEESWPDTLSVLESEIAELIQMRSDFMVPVQGFDLARQVLEHRIDELVAIEDKWAGTGIPAPDTMETLRETLRDKMSSRLITDQERHAFRFHFPVSPASERLDTDSQSEAVDNEEDPMDPGEMMFF